VTPCSFWSFFFPIPVSIFFELQIFSLFHQLFFLSLILRCWLLFLGYLISGLMLDICVDSIPLSRPTPPFPVILGQFLPLVFVGRPAGQASFFLPIGWLVIGELLVGGGLPPSLVPSFFRLFPFFSFLKVPPFFLLGPGNLLFLLYGEFPGIVLKVYLSASRFFAFPVFANTNQDVFFWFFTAIMNASKPRFFPDSGFLSPQGNVGFFHGATLPP